MFLGMLLLFCLFSGLTLIFGANFLQGRDKLKAFLLLGGAVLSIIPLIIVVASFFFPIWE